MFVWAEAVCRWIYVCADILQPVVCESVVFAEPPVPLFKMTSVCKSWSQGAGFSGSGGTRPVGAAVQTEASVGSVAAAVHWLDSPRRPRPPVPIGSTAPKSSELAVARPCGTCEGQAGGGSERDCGGVRGPVLGRLSAGHAGMFHPRWGGGW